MGDPEPVTQEEPKCPEEVKEEAQVDPNDGKQKAESDNEEAKGKFIGFVGSGIVDLSLDMYWQ